jgi:predicted ATPase
LAQYEKCREILVEELGVAPDTKTTALYEQIREGNLTSDDAIAQRIPPSETGKQEARRHNLPVQTTPFIGREIELAELEQLLTDPDVRLVTALGAGGMGKTRLALEAGAGLMDQFPDGVFFISMARLQSEELIVPSIVQVMGIEFAREGIEHGDSKRKLKEILLNHFRRKQLLLILDNYEHLLDGVDLVSEIMQRAPGVKVLATSRARLNVGGEHRFQVAGMEYPEDVSKREAKEYSAVRLFLETARRARSGFEPHPDELEHIADICRLVEGMPLGIRLAAGWVEVLSPQEIAAEIGRSLDLLETDLRDVPERHRSVRALFDHSWNLLTTQEREVYQGFSVFRGGCTREAAQEITGATLRDLRSLVDKSLLHRALNSREYAAEKLQVALDSKETVCGRHSAYFSAATRAWWEDLKSARQATALKARCVALIDQFMEGFWYYFAIRRRWHEAEATFRQAAERFKPGTTGDEQRVYARLLGMQGYFSYGEERRQNLFHQSLKALEKLEVEGGEVRHEKALVLNFMGGESSTSDFDESIRLYRHSLSIFEELGDRYLASEALNGLGITHYLWGKMGEAQKICQQSLAIFKEQGDPRKIALILRLIGFIYSRQGKYGKAERVSRERLEIYKRIGDPSAIAGGQAELGACLRHIGEFEVGETLLEKAREVHKELEHFIDFLDDTIYLCLIKLDLGRYVQTYDLAQSVLDWDGGNISTASSLRVKRYSDFWRIGISSALKGMASLALGNVAEAEYLLERSLAALQEVYQVTNTVSHHSVLGIVSLKLNQPDQAKEHIRVGLRKGLEISSSIAQVHALSATAFFLAGQGDRERAVEIYALASRYPRISKSQWYQDIIEHPLATLTSSLPAEVIAAAQKRGRERDLEETVRELLIELA